MRSYLLSGLAAIALLAAAPAGADPLQTGGISITRGGGNSNIAKGFGSFAGQSVATVGGTALNSGRVSPRAATTATSPPASSAQPCRTSPRSAGPRSARVCANTFGGNNLNVAKGFGSFAGQSVTTVGGTAFGKGAVANTFGGLNTNLAAGKFSSAQQDVLTVGGTAGPFGKNLTFGGANRNAALGFGSTAQQQVVTVSP